MGAIHRAPRATAADRISSPPRWRPVEPRRASRLLTSRAAPIAGHARVAGQVSGQGGGEAGVVVQAAGAALAVGFGDDVEMRIVLPHGENLSRLG